MAFVHWGVLDLHVLKKSLPELYVQSPFSSRLVHTLSSDGNLSSPVVGLRSQPEQRRSRRIVNFDRSDFIFPKKRTLPSARVVEPIKHLSVFLTKICRHPNDGLRGGPRCIGEHLPEVPVIGCRELVLDDQYAIVCEIATSEIKGKPANRVLVCGEFDVDPKNLTQMHRHCLRAMGVKS